MCGILFAKWHEGSRPKNELRKNFQQLKDRGRDSWGYLIQSPEISQTFRFNRSIASISSRVTLERVLRNLPSEGSILFHSRLATSGYSGLDHQNYPMIYGSISMAFNGLITSDIDSNKNNSDGEYLVKILCLKTQDEIESVLNRLKGEITLLWFNETNQAFYCYTNVGNLYITERSNCRLVTSEPINRSGYQNLSSTKVPRMKVLEL